MAGTIDLQYKGPSAHLVGSLPVEVLDGRNIVVYQQDGTGAFPLPAGAYLIRAVDLDGSVVEVEVDLDDGMTFPMHLGYADGPGPLPSIEVAYRPGHLLRELLATSPGDEPLASVALLATEGCEVETIDRGWLFQTVAHPAVTPQAVFRLGARTSTVSLPVNPFQRFPTNACVAVPVVGPTGEAMVAVRFTMQRAVATMVDGLLTNEGVVQGMGTLERATQLLYEKYSDAPAAALGGLTLQRLGRLGERLSWVENLARDFPWIADGRILLAAALAHSDDPADNQRGLDVLMSTEADRPMFADGHGLRLQLLRRWPGDGARPSRAKMLKRVLRDTGTVDWSSAVLTTTGGEGRVEVKRARELATVDA